MSRDPRQPSGEHARPNTDDARLARQWANVSSRLERHPRARLWWRLALGGAVVLAVVAFVVSRRWTSPPPSTVATTSAPSQLVLADGSRVEVAAHSHVSLSDASRDRVHIFLDDGSVECDVTHVSGRPFVVTAAGHDVTVLGTRFVVTVDSKVTPASLSVSVRRGRVSVTGPTGEHVLSAGQSWTAATQGKTSSSEIPPTSTTDSAPATTTATSLDADEPAAAEVSPPASASAGTNATGSAMVEGPRELLARATEARAQGRPRDAAVAFDLLRRRHRGDARAGLAAFELGRLRLDALGDPGGAAEAFSDAIALSPGAPFREDAEARRVEAFDALPDRARCERARDAYLSRYPAGVHAKRTAQRCARR